MSIGVRPAGKQIAAFGAAERGFEAADFPEITGRAGVAHRTVPPVPRRPRAARYHGHGRGRLNVAVIVGIPRQRRLYEQLRAEDAQAAGNSGLSA